MDIVRGLNDAQKDAVTSSVNVLQVLAPPGSGKTKTLTARVAYLIAHRLFKPWNIIVCTFTKKAAGEMKERIRLFIGHDMARQLKLGTFHSVALIYLRQYGHHIGLPKDFGVADMSDSKAILKRIIKKNAFDQFTEGQALSRISSHKAKGKECFEFLKDAKNVDQRAFAQVWMQYQEALEASNLLDYDDILLKCCFLLRTQPQCVSNVEAVLIDEFQDTNNIQYDMMGLFAQQRNVITIVGDPDQSIYSFRSAEIENLNIMKTKWPETHTINLKMNYRSSGAILHAAQKIIEQDPKRPPKKLQATHSVGLRPILRKLPSATGEAEWLVSEIQRVQALTGNMLQASDFVILLRSASLSRVIEAAFGKVGMPYRMVGGIRFYDRMEVKLVLDYMRVVHQPLHNEAVERTLNVPPRKIGETTIKHLLDEAQSKGTSLWSVILDVTQGRYMPKTKILKAAMQGMSQYVNVILSARKKLCSPEHDQVSIIELMNFIVRKLDLQKYLKDKFVDEEEARWANVEELMTQAAEASDATKLRMMAEENSLPVVEGVDQRATSDDEQDKLGLFLAIIALNTTSAEKEEQEGDAVQKVTISTIHAAKGLEWPVVFIPACYEGSIPHSRADDNDEERRLLYVGMTRGQALLYLSSPCKNAERKESDMSTFLTQPGLSTYFEEHGPSIAAATVAGLATTLRRDCPETATITETCSTLKRTEDNYWPVNGELPPEELAKWNHTKSAGAFVAASCPVQSFNSPAITMLQQAGFSTASATLKAGFVSAADRYEELIQESRLKNVDRRTAQVSRNQEQEKPKSRKRQIDGQSTLGGFFGKRAKALPDKEDNSMPPVHLPPAKEPDATPMSELHNFQCSSREATGKRNTIIQHKPRIAPLLNRPFPKRPVTPDEQENGNSRYFFLSSSPPRLAGENDRDEQKQPVQPVESRPASTFHKTTMSVQQGMPKRRTLGMKRSLNGWNARVAR
nr:atp-dependent dna helicase srs2 [Quercus suber]